MPMKRIVMMVMAGCMIGMLTGCGVPQEEHDAKVAELNAAWEEIETYKGNVADLESKLKAEQGKVRNNLIELEAADKRVAEMKDKDAAAAKALADEKGKAAKLESDLAAATSAADMAKNRISELEAALAKLQDELDALQNRFDQLKKNMLSLGGEVSAPAPAPKAAPKADEGAPKSDSKSAMDLLDDMGTL